MATKLRIKQDIWGNWKGYYGARRLLDFGTDDVKAEAWLTDKAELAILEERNRTGRTLTAVYERPDAQQGIACVFNDGWIGLASPAEAEVNIERPPPRAIKASGLLCFYRPCLTPTTLLPSNIVPSR